MDLLSADKLNQLDDSHARQLLIEQGYAPLPAKDVWGREIEYCMHVLARGENGWHQATEKLVEVAEYYRLDGWVSILLKNGDTVSSSRQRVAGKPVYKPDSGSRRYLKYAVIMSGEDGMLVTGMERYLLLDD